MNPIKELSDRMDRWRHLPNYQLERRADLFFSLYLPAALEAKLGFPIRSDMIPEFPVRTGTVYPHNGDNKSFKIDYLALSADLHSAVFVELKTEGRSRRRKQDAYLAAAKRVGLAALLDGLLSIFRATLSKRKYFCLLDELAQMGLLRIPAHMYDVMKSTHLDGFEDAAKKIQVVCPCPVQELHIIYVQPNGPGDDVISFDDFRDAMPKNTDEVANRFAQSLSEWSTVDAGEAIQCRHRDRRL